MTVDTTAFEPDLLELLKRIDLDPALLTEQNFNSGGRYFTLCRADCDDHCEWQHCPQIRDNEPESSGRHCPLDSHARQKRAEGW